MERKSAPAYSGAHRRGASARLPPSGSRRRGRQRAKTAGGKRSRFKNLFRQHSSQLVKQPSAALKNLIERPSQCRCHGGREGLQIRHEFGAIANGQTFERADHVRGQHDRITLQLSAKIPRRRRTAFYRFQIQVPHSINSRPRVLPSTTGGTTQGPPRRLLPAISPAKSATAKSPPRTSTSISARGWRFRTARSMAESREKIERTPIEHRVCRCQSNRRRCRCRRWRITRSSLEQGHEIPNQSQPPTTFVH